MKRVLVATSNQGKIRDLVGAAAAHGIEIATLPNFSALPSVVEDGLTFEANASKKAEYYSQYSEGELVIADDSGLEVDALQGAPGVRPLERHGATRTGYRPADHGWAAGQHHRRLSEDLLAHRREARCHRW